MKLALIVAAVSFLQFFETKNQIANFVIEPPPEGTAVTAEKPSLAVRERCETCAGKGTIALEEQNFGQANGRIDFKRSKKLKCPLCRGTGWREGFMDPSELALQLARDREAYVAAHQGRGEIAVGEAFVPNARYRELDKKTLKLVEAAFGKPCTKCKWTGIEACKKCHGRGTLKCPNTDCKGGWAVTETTTSYSRTSSGGSSHSSNGGFRSSGSRRTTRKETKVNVNVCPDCGGAHEILCPECGGRRAQPCSKCGGLGTKQKAGGQ